jgi:hypothetical protein
VLVGETERLVAGRGLADDPEVPLLPQQIGQRGRHEGVVVGDDDGHLAADLGGHRGTVTDGAGTVSIQAHHPA